MAPRPPDPEKHDAILEAALDLFVEKGFHGTAVPEVAERAGVGAGTIYRYFDSKEALVNAVYQRAKQGFSAYVLDGFPFTAPPREQFHVFWSRMAEQTRDNFRAMAFMELHHHGAYLDEESRALERGMRDTIRVIVAKWRAEQVVKDIDPDVLVAIVWGAFVGLQKAGWTGQLKVTDEVLADGEQCLWEAIRR